jgi:hypothetical protein
VGGTVTPGTQTITLPGTTATLTGSDLTATIATTYTISGSISIGNNVSLTNLTVAVDTGKGTCALTGSIQNPIVSNGYTCTVPAGANHLTITLSSACSTGGGSKKFLLTDGTTSSPSPITATASGSLVIDLGTVSGNITKNISVTKSSTGC